MATDNEFSVLTSGGRSLNGEALRTQKIQVRAMPLAERFFEHETASRSEQSKKTARKAVSLQPETLQLCQARESAAPFCFRRYAMKPTPQKPKIIIAQVEGSGTAAVKPVPT